MTVSSLTVLKSQNFLFSRVTWVMLNDDPSDVSSWQDSSHVFLAKTRTTVLCSSQCLTAGGSWYQMIPSLLVLALRLNKAVSTRIHHKVTISFFVVNEYFVEKYYETMPISCFSSNLHPPIDTSCFHQSSLWCLPNGDFSFFHPPSTFIGWHSPVTKSLPFPIPIYLLLSIGSLNLISFNSLLSLFILILQFSQIWLVRVPCTCFFRMQI